MESMVMPTGGTQRTSWQAGLVAGLLLHAFLIPFFVEFRGLPFRLTTTDVVGATVLGLSLYGIRRQWTRVMKEPLLWPTLAFGAAHILAIVSADARALALLEAVKVAGILLFLLCVRTLLDDADNRRKLVWVLIGTATLLSILSLSEAPGRISGTLGNPNTLGAVLSVLIPIGLGMALDDWRGRRWGFPLVASVATLFMTVALALTGSRGAGLGLLAGLLVMISAFLVLRRKGAVHVVLAVVLVILCLLAVDLYFAYRAAAPIDGGILDLLGKGPIFARLRFSRSDQSRLHLAAAAWQMFLDHPLLGVGPGNFPVHLPDYPPPTGRWHTLHDFPHNFPLHVAAETGIVGLVTLVWWVDSVLRHGYRALVWGSEKDGSRGWSMPLRAGALAGVVAGLVGALFGYPFVHGTWEPFVYSIALACEPGDRRT